MKEGPYFFDGIEVHISDWRPNFNPRNQPLPGSKVWVRFYNCPSDYWHIDLIKDICKCLKTFVSVEDILEDKLWGSFIRICISIEHISKIPEEIKIMGDGKIWIQKIDREDQLHICPKCFSIDHDGLECDVSTTILKNEAYMQHPNMDELQTESPEVIVPAPEKVESRDTKQDEPNIPLIEAIPVNSAPPSATLQN
ncbi:hypothetical protein SUGI_0424090 [Cryptomeria japonica]|nr:hypothetical protein SUGI_0424090 [Cryptomeria japonica]